ncbi:hemerythrin domain-containing protein [uncultured Legionella sp.]|uniref:hemerythrin domain-containing protein n=1 Tax=uncultured Legionella sp. TaxID=210934 RepID=UPI0026073D0B|nr:hemerythrin domain-containing protein [uncultured Legionella sp.]
MNAIDFLIKEHNHVRNLLVDVLNPSHRFDTRQKIFADLSSDLLRHETMEHTVWYPHFKSKVPDTVKHLLKEEQHAEREIKKINELKSEDAWLTHLMKFSEDVEHHAREEEGKLFPEVKAILSEQELEQIGKQMQHFKKEYNGRSIP